MNDDGVSHSNDADIVDTSSLPLWARKVVEDSKVDVSTLDFCNLLLVRNAHNATRTVLQSRNFYTPIML